MENLYVDGDEIDRDILFDALDGVIGIDRDSGDPKLLSEFHELDNKQKFVSLLLYRRAALALGELEEDEVGNSSAEFANIIGIDDSTIRRYVGELSFVENDESKGGYYLPGYNLQVAVDFVAKEDE